MNSLGLAGKVGIKRANDDSTVFCLLGMQTDEVFAVQRENSTSFGNGESEYVLIRQRLFVFPRIRRSPSVPT